MAAIDLSTPIDLPADPAELARCLADAKWRLSHLYKIMVKDPANEQDEGTIINFKPNRAQLRFLLRLWYRNIILKARQLGFTTLICICWLDHALFNKDQRCGVIAHDRDSAGIIFRDKIQFAYDNLPPTLRAMMPTTERNAQEIRFANNSSIRVATSMRSGTIHRLLVSEYGKICAQYPLKAREVQTGSLPAVPQTGIAVIESTAEGQDGDFYKKTMQAIAMQEKGQPLGVKDWRMHFFGWYQDENYRIDPRGVLITKEMDEYFNQVEVQIGQRLDARQRAWYAATFMGDFSGDDQTMWREYPTTPDEAFKVSTAGAYYTVQLSTARKQGRITTVPYMEGVPVNTFWDIGLNDLTAIWFHQRIGVHDRFIHYYENSGEGPSHFVQYMQELKYIYGRTYLPHDGAARRITLDKPMTYEQMLRKLKVASPIIVPRVDNILTGIQMTRQAFGSCWFDEKNCAKGLTHLQNYKKEWNNLLATWRDTPRHDVASNGADAFRQFGQVQARMGFGGRKQTRSVDWKTA